MSVFFFFFVVVVVLVLFLTKSDHRHRWERDSISRNKKKANETPHEEPNRIFMFRVTKEHTKRTKKRHTRRAFFL